MPIPAARHLLKALRGSRFNPGIPHLPNICALCGRWPQSRVCADCWRACFHPIVRCTRCATGWAEDEPQDVPLCGSCLLHPPPWNTANALCSYAYPWSWLIQRWKFHEECHWADFFGQQLRSHEPTARALQQARWVIPIPSSPARLRSRGYDPVGMLARACVSSERILRALQITVEHAAQHRLTRNQRQRNQTSGWQCLPAMREAIQGEHVVLLDDVLTTGSTAAAATRVLRQAGAQHVHLVVIARTEPGGA